jgi:hypothetical protein
MINIILIRNFQMKVFFFFFLSCILLSTNAFAVNKQTYGVYVEDVYRLDYVNSTYDVIFWIWVNDNNEFYDFQKNIDIPKSTIVNFDFENKFKLKNGLFHSEAKITARVLNKFDINSFPFDIQKIKFNVELTGLGINLQNIKFDKKNSRFSPEYIEKWKLLDVKQAITTSSYGSNFGNTDIRSDFKFKRLSSSITLQRNKWSLFIKLYLALFVSFFLAAFSLFLPNKLSEEKIGLMLASLFTSIGNRYITEDIIPIQDSFNLSDRLHILSIIFVALFAVFAIYEQRFKLKDNLKLDIILFSITTIVYFLFVILACYM